MSEPHTDVLGDDLAYWVALHRVHRLGSARFGVLERAFDSMEHVWRAERSELLTAGLDARTATALIEARGRIDPAVELERLSEAALEPIARVDPRYPSRLREIDDAPPLIYVRGAWQPEDEWSVAIGRDASRDGVRTAGGSRTFA